MTFLISQILFSWITFCMQARIISLVIFECLNIKMSSSMTCNLYMQFANIAMLL